MVVNAQNFINGQAARAEFGQYTFTFGGATPGLSSTIPNQQILGGVSGLAWANGTLYVVDSNRLGAIPQDNRVVLFKTGLIPALTADLTNSQSFSTYSCNLCAFPAFNQLGQPQFKAPIAFTPSAPDAFPIGVNNDATQPNMRQPTAVATDGNILAVADTDNNRVLLWNSIPTALNQPANVVLGQADFTHSALAGVPSASSLLGPQGVWIQDGRLFVADTQNYRVLIWNHIPTSNNQPADVVLGQSNFTTGTQSACAPSNSNYVSAANTLCNPVSVTSDGAHVFVADLGFNRVLIWNTIPAANGQNADVVLGQPDMVSAVSNNPVGCLNTGTQVQCDVNMSFPRYALSDGRRLFVADGGNDRVLIFNTIPTQNGARADGVLGQPSFQVDNVTSQSNGIASTAVDTTSAVDVTPSPTSLAYDGQNLYVSDPLDNRVLVFTPGNSPLPDNSVVNWASEVIRQEGVVSLGGTFAANDTVTITVATKPYAYTVKNNDSLDAIAQGLVSLINAGSGDPNVIAIFAGTGSGSAYLSSRQTSLSFDSVAFSVATSNTTTGTATASGNGYLSAGNAATGSPGMLVEINGSNLSDLSPGNPANAALTGTIPTSLGGAQVFMDGVATPVYSASSNRVVSQIPYNLAGRNSTSVFVRTTHNDGSVTVTNATPIYIAPANPGIFDAPANKGDVRPWPATGAYHQAGNPQAVIDVTGTVNAGDVATVKIGSASYNYTVVAADTLSTIVTGIVNAINNGNDPSATATYGAAFNRVVVVARQSGAAGNGISVAGSVSGSAKITLTAYTNQTCCNVIPGSLLTPSNPAAPGETITLSAAGLGQVQNLSGNVISDTATGGPYNGYPINTATNSVSATIGTNNTTAQVVGAGLTQGSYGIYQVQIIIPQDQATNAATQVSIAQNAFISNIVTIPVGPAVSNPNNLVGASPIKLSIDNPAAQGPALSGIASVGGWAVEANVAVSSVQISVDGVPNGTATYGGSRPDVCAAVGQLTGCPNVGFNYALDTTQFADGAHNVSVTVTDANGLRLTHGASFTSSNYTTTGSTVIDMDSPGGRGGVFQGVAVFGGWVINRGSAITGVTVSVDGVSRGSASYGIGRGDVCAIPSYSSSPSCPNVGWSYSLDTSALANGSHVFALSATAANGERSILAHPFTVANWTTATPIIINFDKPAPQSAPLSGVTNIGGWAVNPLSPIVSLSLSVDGIPVGNASYGAARPDVCGTYPTAASCPNVGWNFVLDTTVLADGMHTLAATATPVSGQGFTQTTQFRVSNLSATGTILSIDTPAAQSAPVSGYTAFGGWALNQSSAIGTVEVSIDGNPSGFALYGAPRGDVCAVHVGVPGCPNVGWNYLLDTSTLTNGLHTVEVTGTGANGQRATVSSTFTVANSAGVSPTSVSIAQPGAASSPYQGSASFSGSALSSSSTISSIFVTIDGYPYGSATYTPAGANAPVNWSYMLNTVPLPDGPHTFGVTAMAADGTFSLSSATFTVANWSSPSPIRVTIDSPRSSSAPIAGSVAFGGWAFDPNSTLTSVQIAIDGVSFGAAAYGGTRSDVCAVYGNVPGCPGVGWNFPIDSTILANGSHTLAVTAVTSTGQSATMSTSFIVGN